MLRVHAMHTAANPTPPHIRNASPSCNTMYECACTCRTHVTQIDTSAGVSLHMLLQGLCEVLPHFAVRCPLWRGKGFGGLRTPNPGWQAHGHITCVGLFQTYQCCSACCLKMPQTKPASLHKEVCVPLGVLAADTLHRSESHGCVRRSHCCLPLDKEPGFSFSRVLSVAHQTLPIQAASE